MTEVNKKVEFRGDSRKVVRDWPDDARRTAGDEIFRVQTGKEPHDWKPFSDVGPGVREIRIREESGAFRVMYQATVGDAVYVLHAFQKKTQKTAKADVEIARQRFKDLMQEIRHGKR